MIHKMNYILILFLLFLAQQVLGQSTPDRLSIRTQTDLVLVDVLPLEKKTGRIVQGLGRDDFALFEDGVKQTISHFSQDKLPISILLLVDRAGCVNAFNETIREATIRAFSQLKVDDEVAIMTFSNTVSLVQSFTRDRDLIKEQILKVEPQHESEQHYFNSAIYQAADYIGRAAVPHRKRAIIVLTSLEASIDFSKRSSHEALQVLLESGAVVSGVLVQTMAGRMNQAFRGKPTSFLRHLGLRAGSLKMFADQTGGEVVSATPEKLSLTITTLVEHLCTGYSLAYMPTNLVRDGKRRRIRLDLSPAALARTGRTALLSRRSYIMPKAEAAPAGQRSDY
jgi:VWFA-related protein